MAKRGRTCISEHSKLVSGRTSVPLAELMEIYGTSIAASTAMIPIPDRRSSSHALRSIMAKCSGGRTIEAEGGSGSSGRCLR